MFFTDVSSERVARAFMKKGFKIVGGKKHIVMSDGAHFVTIPRHKRINPYTLYIKVDNQRRRLDRQGIQRVAMKRTEYLTRAVRFFMCTHPSKTPAINKTATLSAPGFLCRAASFARSSSIFFIRSLAVASLLLISSKLNVFANTGQAVDSWVSMANAVPTGAAGGACIVYAEKGGNPKIYNIRGGATGFGIYDINTNVWVSTTALPYVASSGANMTWDGGNSLYILLGGATFYHFDISAATFTRLTDPPGNVAGGGAIVYVSTQTGFNWCYAYQGGTTVFWRYDINTGSWITRQAQTAATGSGGALLWTGDNFIYGFIGGSNAGLRRYNINTDAVWTSLANASQTIGAGGSLVWDGVVTSSNIYAFRGNTSTSTFKYNISSDQWVYVSSAPLTIGTNTGNKLARVGDYIYGRRGLTTDDFWRYRWRDTNAPGAITSFAAVTGASPGEINLSWVSPGNDSYTGALPVGSTFYIQYATWTGVNFSTDTRPPTDGYDLSIPTGPVTPGTSVYYTLSSLTGGVTYYFRIWSRDNAGNWSDISVGATSWAQVFPVIPARPSWVTGEIEVTTGSVKWVLKNEHTDTAELFLATGQSVPQRIVGAELGGILTTATTSWTEYDLDPNTAYTRYGEAYLATGSSWSSGLTKYTLAIPPAAPTAVALSYNTIDVSWAGSPTPPSKYIIARSVDNFATPWSTAAVVLAPGTTHQDTGLAANTGYKYRIYVINGDDVMSTVASPDSAATLTYPAAPTAFAASNVYITSITWSWTASAGGADGYRVYMASSPSTMAADVAAATTYNEENLGPNAEYGRFAVAYNATGESLSSNETTTYTLAAAPTALEITNVFSSSVTLSWTDGVNPAGTRYGIARDDNSGFAGSTTFYTFADALTDTTASADGLGGGATYYFRVWAFNNGPVASAYSNAVSTVMPPGVPGAPDGLYGLAVSTTVIKWEWNITLNATYYQIFGPDPDTLIANIEDDVLAGGATTWFEHGLNPNVNYTRYVKAGNASGLSGVSGAASRYTYAHPPAALASSAVSSSTINLSWDDSGATEYQVWVSTAGPGTEPLTNPTTTASLAYAHGNLSAGVTHYYRIIPVNGNDLAYAAFDFPTASTRTLPSPVATFTATAFTNDSITWQWSAAVGADFYNLYNAATDALVQTLGDVVSYQETGLGVNAQAGRYVRAYNTSGAGVVSPSATFFTLAAVPGTPTVSGVTTTSVGLTWPDGGNPSGTNYGIIRSQNNFVSTTTLVGYGALTLTSYTDNTASADTNYQYKITAFNGDALATGYTAAVSTTTNALPNMLTNGGFETGNTSGWTVSGASSNGTVTSPVYAGTYAVYIATAGSTGMKNLYQNIAVTAGKSYILSGYAYLDGTTNQGCGIGVKGGGGGLSALTGSNNFVSSTTATGSWVYLELSTLVPTGTITLGVNIYLRTNGTLTPWSTAYFDNIVFAEVPDTKPPNAISNLTALPGATDGLINLAWSSPSDDGLGVKPLAGGYIIKYSSVQIINSADFNAPTFAHGSVVISTSGVAPGAAVGYTLSLTPGASYWFAIKSTDTAGNLSVWKSSSDVSTVNTAAYGWAYDAAPPVPANLAATASENSIMLTWNAVAASDLSHYELRCDSTPATAWDDDFIATNTINTSFTHANLENGVTYYYKVKAVDLPPLVLASDFSTAVSTFPRPSAPFAPSLSYDLTATTTDTIKWVMTDNSTNETGLHISSAANIGARLWSSNSLASSGNTTSWISTGLGANEAVTRYAEASNAVGSAWSGAVTRYTRARPPTTLAADAIYFSSMTLSWAANGNLGSPKYEISISSDKFSVFFATPIALAANHTAVTADIAGLVQGATYWVRARAYNGDTVVSVFSSTMNFITNRVPTQYLKIANPGFEMSPALTGWTKEGTAGSINTKTSVKRSGTYSCELNNPTGSYGARRIVASTATIVGGNNYSVGAWFYVANGGGVISDTQIQIGVRWINNAGAVIYTSTTTDLSLSAFASWEKLTYSDVAPASAVGAIMIIDVKESVTLATQHVYVDDVDNAPDTTPPGAITNLAAAKGANPGEISITWTAPGDDGYAENNGAAAVYTLRYATYPMVAASSWTWRNNAIVYYQAWPVAPVGATESRTVSLVPGVTYYFLARTQDAAGNISDFDINALGGAGVQASAIAKEGRTGGKIVINEINCSKTPNWIELYNPSTYSVVMDGWKVYEIAESTFAAVKTYSPFSLPAGQYAVITFGSGLTDDITPYTVSGDTYYKNYTNNAGLTATDNAIVLKDGSGTCVDAVFFTDGSGSLTGSTIYKIALNEAITNNQWTAPISPSDEDVEKNYTASSRYLKSGVTLARDDKSTDGTNPSKAEWHVHAAPTPGAPTEGYKNRVPDTMPPAQINNLAAVTGDNRGTINLSWTAPGEDGAANTAQLYIVRYSPNVIADDAGFDAAEVKYNDKSFTYALDSNVYETITWNPSAPGAAQSYALGSLTPGVTYYIAVKTEDEQPNRSLLSNVVTLYASNSVGSNVRINEVAPMETNDWIELYNATTNQVDLSGWEICTNIQGTDISGVIEAGSDYSILKTIPSGFVLPATSYAILNMGYGTPPADETSADTNGNGWRDLYSANSLMDIAGVVFIRNKNKTFVDAVAYSDGIDNPNWSNLWKWFNGHRQWSPATASMSDAADWSAASGGRVQGRTFGRDSFSTDTDDTAAAKNDWKIFLVPTKGTQNDDVPPGAITNLSALADAAVEGKITLTWTAPGDDGYIGNNSGGRYLVKYATYSVDTSSLAWWNSISTSAASNINKGWVIKTPPSALSTTETQIFTGLYPSATYYFAARTVDDVANWSALDLQIGAADPAVQAQAIATNLPPAAPTGVVAVSSNTAAMLSWNANSELDLNEYRISKNTVNDFADGGTSLVAVVSSSTLSHTAGGLTNGVTYYFWIQGTDVFALTGSTSATVSAYPVLKPPSGLSAAHKGSRVELSWTASPDYASTNFAGYAIYRSSVSSSADFNLLTVLTGGGSTTHYDTSGVSAIQTYYYFMKSSDTAGPESAATSVVTAVPDDKGPIITAISPAASTVRVAVKGSKIVMEATVRDDETTAYISGVASATVSVAYSTAVGGVSSLLAMNMVADSDSYIQSRLLGARFKVSLDANTSGIITELKNILSNGGTFYFAFYSQDKTGNLGLGSVGYTVAIQAEPKTSVAVTAASGGNIALTDGNPDDGETSVTIPAGALPTDATISIKQEDPASSGIPKASSESSIKTDINDKMPVAVYSFGPEKTAFKKPVTITLLYFETAGEIKNIAGATITGATEDDLRIYWWDGVEWRYVGGAVDKTKNTVSAKVSHFSLYAIFVSKGAPEKPTAAEKFVTPNADGINDTLQFDGSSDDFKEITIYDINGRIIRKLENLSIWDAQDENGKVVEIGAYIWRAVYANGTVNYGTVVVAK